MTLDELRAGAGDPYLFHYTDAVHADEIRSNGIFESGPGAAHGPGVYATDIPPIDADSVEDVLTNCFRGERTEVEVNHAIVLLARHGSLCFEQTSDPYQWVLPTGKLDYVHIDGIYIATVAWDGTQWHVIDFVE